jgi:multidrug resistance efflux pump
MMDIINPWGALRRAKARIADLEADIEHLEEEADEDYLIYKNAAQHLERIEALIAEGHFRNPKTGRLGRKGVTYK